MGTLKIGSILLHLGNKYKVVKLNSAPVVDNRGYLIGDEYSKIYFKVILIDLGNSAKIGDHVGQICNFTYEQIEKNWVIIL